jgi:cyclin D2
MLAEEASCLAPLSDYCSPASLLQPELRPHMRRIVTDWMLEVCEDQETQGPEVFLLAVHYLDSFLSAVTIRKTQFQLAAATCLLLASKFSSVVPLSAVQLVLYTDHSVTVAELLEWELEVLGALRWQLAALTAHSFLEQLLPRLALASSLGPAQLARLRRHATTLAALAATEPALITAPRSLLAGAALAAAHLGLGLPELQPALPARLAALLHCPEDRLAQAARALEASLLTSLGGREPAMPAKDPGQPGGLPTFHSLPGHQPAAGPTTPTSTLDVSFTALAA